MEYYCFRFSEYSVKGIHTVVVLEVLVVARCYGTSHGCDIVS